MLKRVPQQAKTARKKPKIQQPNNNFSEFVPEKPAVFRETSDLQNLQRRFIKEDARSRMTHFIPKANIMRPETRTLAELWRRKIHKMLLMKKKPPVLCDQSTFSNGIDLVVGAIVKQANKGGRPPIILIGGGGATGKSTISRNIIKQLTDRGIESELVELDHYFKESNKVIHPEDGKYDNPINSYLDEAKKNIETLKAGKKTDVSVHDKKNHSFTILEGRSIIPIDSNNRPKVIIYEGLYTLNPDIQHLGDVKVYVEATDTERAKRRFQRDKLVRGRTTEHITEMLMGRQPYHQAFIEVSKPIADIIFQSPETPSSRFDIEVAPGKFGRLMEKARALKGAGIKRPQRRKIITALEKAREKRKDRVPKEEGF